MFISGVVVVVVGGLRRSRDDSGNLMEVSKQLEKHVLVFQMVLQNPACDWTVNGLWKATHYLDCVSSTQLRTPSQLRGLLST